MRSDFSIIKIINKWGKAIDFFNVSLLLFLIILGLLFVTTSSPSVAKLKGLGDFYFIMIKIKKTSILNYILFITKKIIN